MQSQIWRHASSREETEWAEAVGDGDEDDALFGGKMLAIVEAGEDASNLEKNKVKCYQVLKQIKIFANITSKAPP